MAFANTLISYLDKHTGKPTFGQWTLSKWKVLEEDIGYAMGLDVLIELYQNGREEINIVVNSRHQVGVDLLSSHTLTEDDKKLLKTELEKLGYKDIIIQDFNQK